MQSWANHCCDDGAGEDDDACLGRPMSQSSENLKCLVRFTELARLRSLEVDLLTSPSVGVSLPNGRDLLTVAGS